MGKTDKLSPPEYADLVRRVVAWVQMRQQDGRVTHWYDIRNRYALTNDEIDMICGDSEVYGPRLMCHANDQARRYTTVEVLA